MTTNVDLGLPADVAAALATLPVSRLVHFTPAMNLFSILRDGEIRPSNDLETDDQTHFTATDDRRFDDHPGHICCSFEYPNAYYQGRARTKADFINYPQWVCLTLDLELALRDGVLFHPCNAAKGRGGYGGSGPKYLLNMWADPSIPAGYSRGAHHHPAVPTDVQAEVQIPGAIPLSSVKTVVAQSAEHCNDLYGTLATHGLSPERFEWSYSPLFYEPSNLAAVIHRGSSPPEFFWTPTVEVHL